MTSTPSIATLSIVSARRPTIQQHTPLSVVIEELVLVWTASTPEDWLNRLVEIPLR